MDQGDWYAFSFVVLVQALTGLGLLAIGRWRRKRDVSPEPSRGVTSFQIAVGILLFGSVLALQFLVIALDVSLLGVIVLIVAWTALIWAGLAVLIRLFRRAPGE
jgi:hypothetical protein